MCWCLLPESVSFYEFMGGEREWGGWRGEGRRRQEKREESLFYCIHEIFHKWHKWWPKMMPLPFKRRQRQWVQSPEWFSCNRSGHLSTSIRWLKDVNFSLNGEDLGFFDLLKPLPSLVYLKMFLISWLWIYFRLIAENLVKSEKQTKITRWSHYPFTIGFALPFVNSKLYHKHFLLKNPVFSGSVALCMCVCVHNWFFSIIYF